MPKGFKAYVNAGPHRLQGFNVPAASNRHSCPTTAAPRPFGWPALESGRHAMAVALTDHTAHRHRPGRGMFAWLVVTLTAFYASLPSTAAEQAAPAVYYRSLTDTNGVLRLEVAARELRAPGRRSARVWLVGVIHLGEPDYYQRLQRFLDRQTVVLYEGVGAQDGRFELQDQEFSLQQRLAQALGLVFQLDAIDYQRPQFKNSDLTYGELAALFRGSPAVGAGSVARPSGSGPGRPAEGQTEFNALVQMMEGRGLFGGLARLGVKALETSARLRATTKLMMIEMFGSLPPNLADTAGMPEGMRHLMEKLIAARNDVVVRDLRRELRGHRHPDTIAVFYGAGHMADLELKLRRELGLRPRRVRWFTAMRLDPRAVGLTPLEVGMARAMARLQLRSLGGGEPSPAPQPPEPPPPGSSGSPPPAAATTE